MIDRLSYFYEHENSNIHRAAHTLAARATDAYEGARDTVRAVPRRADRRGDRLRPRHHRGDQPGGADLGRDSTSARATRSSSRTWSTTPTSCPGSCWPQRGRRHHQGRSRWTTAGSCCSTSTRRLITERTKLVSVTQVSNALGTVTPVQEIIDVAHRHGARVLVDGAQSVAHLRGRRAGARMPTSSSSPGTRSSVRPASVSLYGKRGRAGRTCRPGRAAAT